MRPNASRMIAPVITSSVLCCTAPSFAAEGTLPGGAPGVAVVTMIAVVLLLLLGVALYLKVASLHPLVLRTGAEAKAREEREENARAHVAKASADLHTALSDLHEEIELARQTQSAAHAAVRVFAPAPDDSRDLIAKAALLTTSTPPREVVDSSDVSDTDRTHVLSRRTVQATLAGGPQAAGASSFRRSERPAPPCAPAHAAATRPPALAPPLPPRAREPRTARESEPHAKT